MTQYLRLSRNVLAAAVWLKHYVEAGGIDRGRLIMRNHLMPTSDPPICRLFAARFSRFP